MARQSHYHLERPSFSEPVKVLIVVAPSYKDIADHMVAGARAAAAHLLDKHPEWFTRSTRRACRDTDACVAER